MLACLQEDLVDIGMKPIEIKRFQRTLAELSR